MRAARRALSGDARTRAQDQICGQIRAHHAVRSARSVALYYPFDGEVSLEMLWGGGLPTRPLEASDASWPWVFPDHHPNQPLTFIEPTSWEIKRPLPRPQGRVIPLQEIDVILVPGVAFDPQKGARLGLGGGHYDRTLSKGAERSWSGLAFGVGFALQVSRTLPIESWDVPLDGLFTEFGFARPEHRQDHSIERRGRETKR